MKMRFSEWEKLSEEEQNAVPDKELPEIPEAELRNNLILSEMFRRDGVLMWRVQSAGEAESEVFPHYRRSDKMGMEVWYSFNPYNATYDMIREPEPDEPIGNYGHMWMNWMREEHKIKVPYLEATHTFRKVARKVDAMARDYSLLLQKQYEQANPRPEEGYEDLVKWGETMMYYVDSAVMREVVLVAYSPDFVK